MQIISINELQGLTMRPASSSINEATDSSSLTTYPLQGQRKLLITGQAKLNPQHYSIKCVGVW